MSSQHEQAAVLVFFTAAGNIYTKGVPKSTTFNVAYNVKVMDIFMKN